MQRQAMYFARWLTPFLPPMAVLAAEATHLGVKQLISATKRQYPWFWRTVNPSHQKFEIAAIIGLVLLLTLPSTYMALRADNV